MCIRDRLVECADFMRNAISQEELEQHLFHALQVMFSPESSTQATTDQYSLEVEQSIAYIKENLSLIHISSFRFLSQMLLFQVSSDGNVKYRIGIQYNKADQTKAPPARAVPGSVS